MMEKDQNINLDENIIVNEKKSMIVLSTTVCLRSSDPFYTVTSYIKWGHYFLDIY